MTFSLWFILFKQIKKLSLFSLLCLFLLLFLCYNCRQFKRHGKYFITFGFNRRCWLWLSACWHFNLCNLLWLWLFHLNYIFYNVFRPSIISVYLMSFIRIIRKYRKVPWVFLILCFVSLVNVVDFFGDNGDMNPDLLPGDFSDWESYILTP